MKLLFLFHLLLIGISINLSLAKSGPPEIIIDDSFTSINIEEQMTYLPFDKEYDMDDVLGHQLDDQFLSISSLEIPNDHFSVWLSFVIKNELDYPQEVYVGSSEFDYLEFYIPNSEDHDVYKGGILENNADKKYKEGCFSFGKFSLPANSKKQVFIKGTYVNGAYFQFTALPFTVYKSESFEKINAPQEMLHYLFLGAMLIMTFYNLFLLIIVKDKTYAFYVGYNIFITIYCLGLSGFLSENVFPTASYQEQLVNIPGIFALIFYVFFAQSYLKLHKYYPKLNTLLNIQKAGSTLSFVLYVLDFTTISIVYNFIAASLAYTTIIVLAYRVSKKSVAGKYFFIAGIFYISSMGVSILQMLEILPTHLWIFSSANITEIGVVLELSLFSLGLGERINEARRAVAKKELEKKALIEQKNRELEQKVKDRTIELEEMNSELATTNEELHSTMETVFEQNKIIELKNTNITQSINYAQRIQEAMMPTDQYLSKFLRNHFVLFRPKDIVSGDFYWAYHLENKEDFFLATVDCTGHGVPGGFMSMLGSELLRDVIEHRKVVDPAEVLKFMNEGIENALKQNDSQNKDGMDMSLCRVNLRERKIYYSGAKRPLVIVRHNGEIEIIKGCKLSIGGLVRKDLFSYETTVIDVNIGDKFYMFSDGYADQIGGVEERKFMTKRFRELLRDTSYLSMQDQGKKIEQVLEEWISYFRYGQVDDITVVGFEI
ncbi:SpoIIE family protein phosphatase [Flammeovirga yaeyamensis]|uniref:SpoIIE family protein phosphatase n=1 Tax=Flammeovirga yaeyamensis TaxID=367791 RepID=A0AAX1N3G5_9BACT|nr:7TM diverse intracellular signaling domain-containing protein [Flammeovirga yaeyamensis]MBB3699594.1 serine phosphatase RsbU (regulator of sigma subunit) [Flammeovirga yaeyamensis]NMF36833.1 SpoIIE family protein phosphatase [Flammeovirga yaeyamensis]QWG02128.1 SpoIIE family protein phosphatase [Flammeovirga yaeyamensis]